MCGIFGIVTPNGQRISLDDASIERLRDRLTHRGPDGAGLWRHENCVLAHRRLSVVDVSDAGAQPMILNDTDARPTLAISYNGELYNDAHWRARLQGRAVSFSSSCDTETVLHAWNAEGHECLNDLRGMYAIAIWDVRRKTLTLARDPLGVKPLYFARTTRGAGEIVFASEPATVAAHPNVGASPNWKMVSAYLTTIRTVLGDQTMYEGVHAVRPGEAIEFDCSGPTIKQRHWFHWRGMPVNPDEQWSDARAAQTVRETLEDSVNAHLRADVETCSLLSGGLDSTVIARTARANKPDLRTYCAGAREGAGAEDDDLDVARRAAAYLDTRHEEALITRSGFAERWRWLAQQQGVPLTTPNEVAIYEVASRLRADGCIVTLSGEGADELFAGYDITLRSALAYRTMVAHADERRGPGAFELESNAWIGPSIKAGVVREDVLREAEWDAWLARWYEDEFTRTAEEVGHASNGIGADLAAHLRFTRRINLTSLLQRLDTATMLASVESRVPFADARVAEMAEALPMSVKVATRNTAPTRAASMGAADSAGTGIELLDVEGDWETKACLRRAFSGVLPDEVVHREKRSFPLPFREWIEDSVGVLRESALAREVFRDEAVALVCEHPKQMWNLAWPMVNLAMWDGGEH